ncbi:MAG: PIG-L family deacetylase [Alphaproteobacteria bacterium]|nr:PIG-L family deacetylase [Alphaproteobacteria bacterium]
MDESIFKTSEFVVAAPHPDDAAFACGGLLAEAIRRGIPVAIHTLFTVTTFADGKTYDDPALPTAKRRKEEEAYAALLGQGCKLVYHDFEEALVRKQGSFEAIYDPNAFGPIDQAAADDIAHILKAATGEGKTLLLPMGLGHHLDHSLVRDAGLGITPLPARLYLYEDLPYAQDYTPDDIGIIAQGFAAAHARTASANLISYPDFEAIKRKGMACYPSQDGDGSVSAQTLDCGRRLVADGVAERYWQLG